MAAVLHLVKNAPAELTLTAIEQQRVAGDVVSIALLHGAPVPSVSPGIRIVRVPDELPYTGLLDLIFSSDHVVTW